ncbi:MAG: hypothetical protein FD131_4839 [Rhodocyclaceae bacterium]|nr:MAG: hypothetical protein FD131_4839 [Rhodocyclaceae bacterium]
MDLLAHWKVTHEKRETARETGSRETGSDTIGLRRTWMLLISHKAQHVIPGLPVWAVPGMTVLGGR